MKAICVCLFVCVLMHMCVRVHMNVCVWEGVLASVCMQMCEGQKSTSSVVFRTGYLSSLKGHQEGDACWPACKLQGSTYPRLLSTGITSVHYHAWLLCGFGGLNSEPHACTANCLQNKPSPQS